MPSRIVIVRLDGIGDALVCTPLIAALRAAGHELGLVLSDRNATIFAPGTAVATHVLERIPWPKHGSTPASRARAVAQIAAQRYDVALVASEEPEAYELARPIARRVGFVTGWAKPFKSLWARRQLTRPVSRAASIGAGREHEALEMFRLGAGFVDGPPSRDAAVLRPLVAGDGPLPERSGVVVQLGAKWNASGVGDATVGAVIAALRERAARFIAAPGEADALRERFPGTAVDAPPSTRAWVAAIDSAAALVSVDTGAAHVAGMLGVPVVDIFPDAQFDAQTRRWQPWASSSIVLRASELARAPRERILQALDAL